MKRIVVFIFSLLLVVGCSETAKLDNRVFGEWVEDTTNSFMPSKPIVLTFNEDGSYTAFYPASSEEYNDINDKGSYKTKVMPNPEKWKNGGCIIVLDSDFGNDYELDFIAYQTEDSCFLTYHKIVTDRNGNVSVSESEYDQGQYFRK